MIVKLLTGDEITCQSVTLDGQDVLAKANEDNYYLVPIDDISEICDDLLEVDT